MNIYAKFGEKVSVDARSLENGYESDTTVAKKNLKEGVEYHVEKVIPGRFKTIVILQEFPGVKFNSVNFI